MRVVFDAERLRNPNSGLGQFCLSLAGGLLTRQPADATLSLILPGKPSSTALVVRAPVVRAAWWQRYVAPLTADVWHATHQDYWIRPARDARVVLSIMDLNFLERADYSQAKKARRLAAVQRKVDRASAIATISQFTADEVRRRLTVPDIPVRVIHLGNPLERVMQWGPRDDDTETFGLRPGSFFFFIGVLHPKKNVHTLVPLMRAFPEMTLVLAGPGDGPYAAQLRQAVHEAGLGDRVKLTGAVDDTTKVWLYRNCRALLFPSLSEGFGLPVVEAMSQGKPAFLSRLTSLPEIGGSAAYYFDSFGPDAMIDTIRRGLDDYDRHPGRADEIKRHAAQFSWDRAATAYWKLYDEVHRSPRR